MFKSLSFKITLGMAFLAMIMCGLIYYGAIKKVTASTHSDLTMQQKNYILGFEDIIGINSNNHPYIDSDGSLKIGDYNLENDTYIVDTVSQMANGVATIFKGDIRVASSIKNAEGVRVVGTALNNPEIWQTVAVQKKQFTKRVTLFGKDYYSIYSPLADKTGAVIGLLFIGVEASNFDANTENLSNNIMINSIATLIGVVIIMTIMLKIQFAPIPALNSVIQTLTTGNLTVEIPEKYENRSDEIGSLAASINCFKNSLIQMEKMKEKQKQMEAEEQAMKEKAIAEEKEMAEKEKRLKEEEERRKEEEKLQTAKERKEFMINMANEFENQIGSIVSAVASTATELNASSESLSSMAAKSSQQASTGSNASENAANNVQTVAAATEELNSSIREISEQITNTSAITKNAVIETEATTKTMDNLSKSANQIGEIINMIKDIANQTNLLALNATIEAARAGDVGKGFSVVANEVKSLANQTAKATDDISAQISDMQKIASEAVEAIRKIKVTITSINQNSTAVASSIEEQGAATQEISRNIQQAAVGTKAVSETIANINVSVAETGREAKNVNMAAKDLSEQGEKLKSEVARFINEIRSGE